MNKPKNRKCSLASCEKKHYALGYCVGHYKQFKKYGRIMREQTGRVFNQYIEHDDYFEIICFARYGGIKAIALIDKEDFDRCKEYQWFLRSSDSNKNYVGACSKMPDRKIFSLHHFILGKPPHGMEVDHINHDKSDCRRKNLRFCTRSQNHYNRSKTNFKSSRFKGVRFVDNGWQAMCCGKYIGRFINEEDAANAYNNKLLEIGKEFAHINQIITEDNHA